MSVEPLPGKEDAAQSVTILLDPDTLCVTVAQAATALGISQKATYRLLDEGEVECRFLGRRRLVLWASLKTYLDALPSERD